MSGALWAPDSTLDSVTANHDVILIGRAVKVEVGYPLSGFILFELSGKDSASPPAGHPKSSPSAPTDEAIGPVGSWYTIEVTDVLKGEGIARGDAITVTQFGGVIGTTLYQDPQDPVMRLGATYLLFLDGSSGTYAAPPFGRFEASADGGLRGVNAEAWGYFPIVQQLEGRTVAEATVIISAAVED